MNGFRLGYAVKGLTVPTGFAALTLDSALASAFSLVKKACQPSIFENPKIED
jgi:hypothetical protein